MYNYIGLGLNFEIRGNGIRWNETKHVELEQFLHAFTSRGFDSVRVWQRQLGFLVNKMDEIIVFSSFPTRNDYVYGINTVHCSCCKLANEIDKKAPQQYQKQTVYKWWEQITDSMDSLAPINNIVL